MSPEAKGLQRKLVKRGLPPFVKLRSRLLEVLERARVAPIFEKDGEQEC
jgi:hypothetical protein